MLFQFIAKAAFYKHDDKVQLGAAIRPLQNAAIRPYKDKCVLGSLFLGN